MSCDDGLYERCKMWVIDELHLCQLANTMRNRSCEHTFLKA